MRSQQWNRHLIQPLQGHGLVALDLDAVLLQVEKHPLGLEPGVRERVHDDAHVKPGGLLLLEDLGDPPQRVRRVLLYRVEAGQLRECWLYDEDQRFIDKLWSSEPGE